MISSVAKIFAALLVFFVACEAETQRLPATSSAEYQTGELSERTALGGVSSSSGERVDKQPNDEAQQPSQGEVHASELAERYVWLEEMEDIDQVISLSERFEPPEGFDRVEVESDSYAKFLRELPTLPDRTTVRAYDGRRLDSPAGAIVALDVGDRDLQQCATTAIRLRAEYLWQAGRHDEIAYHFSSGDRSAGSDWVDGERFVTEGSSVERRDGPQRSSTRTTFREYLDHLFIYAGTMSLRYDAHAVAPQDLQAGDLFVDPGSPGHAVILLDIAESPDGRRAALVGQGFMPAQELHIVHDTTDRVLDDVWFLLPDEDHSDFDTPSWPTFSADQALRFQ